MSGATSRFMVVSKAQAFALASTPHFFLCIAERIEAFVLFGDTFQFIRGLDDLVPFAIKGLYLRSCSLRDL